ncbi:COMM domain-containing protein 8 [Lamellibrachia satsuma]|nr:COMM domain-containing protein 8 [Lamellibrachia satsuma]
MEDSDKIQNDGAKLLTKCPQNRISTLIHRIIDALCEKSPPCYEDFANVWGLEEWWEVTDFYKTFCRDAVKKACTKETILSQLEFLQLEYSKEVRDAVWIRRDEIRVQLVKKTTEISQAYLKDFDWQLKLVVSSDKLASVQEPLLSVDLDIDAAGEDETKFASVEMNKADLQKMITSLEAANKAVMQLKS